MPGLVPGIHDFQFWTGGEIVDGRDKPGHDEFGLGGEGRLLSRGRDDLRPRFVVIVVMAVIVMAGIA
jgi:hypothetical protein